MVKFVSKEKNIQEFLDERNRLSVFDEAENWTDEEWCEYEDRLREYSKTLPEVLFG